MTRLLARAAGPALVATTVLLALVTVASARPVRVGRYVEIPYGVSEAHPWPTGGGSARRDGRSRYRAPARVPQKRWEVRVGRGRAFAPLIAEDGTLYVGSGSGLTAVDPEGRIAWRLPLGLASGTPSMTPEGHVAVAARPGELIRVTSRGQAARRLFVGGVVRGSPLVLADGSAVVAAFDHALHRFDADGRRLFRVPVDSQIRSEPALTPDSHVLLAVGDELRRFGLDGAVRGAARLDGQVIAGPVVSSDGTSWVLTRRGVLQSFGPDLSPRGRVDLGVRPTATNTLAVGSDGAVRVGAANGPIACIGAGGTLRWRADARTTFPGAVTLDADDAALAVGQDRHLHVFEEDGSVRYRIALGERTDAAPVLGADGTIYVATFSGTLQAWR